jgi:hypothetical protein
VLFRSPVGCAPDDTFLVFRDAEPAAGGGYDLVRLDRNGRVVPTWPEARTDGGRKGPAQPPPFERTGHRPVRFARRGGIAVGRDGSVYVWAGDDLLKLDRSGRRIYVVRLPFDRTLDRLCGDEQGRAYVLGRRDDAAFVLEVDPEGRRAVTVVANHRAGGVLDRETVLALAANGALHVAGDGGQWHVVDPDGTVRRTSRRPG